MKKVLTFPTDFVKIKHPTIAGAWQWLHGNDDDRISIVGGGTGLYGDGIETFEMMHPDMDGQVKGYMTKDEINEYLSIIH